MNPCLLALLCTLAQAPDAGPQLPELELPTATCPDAPQYPAAERSSGVRGVVQLRVTLDGEGAISDLAVTQSLGPAFDAAAVEHARGCAYTGAKRQGVPAPALLELAIEYLPPALPWVLRGKVVGELGQALAGARVAFGGQEAVADASGAFHLTFEAMPPGEDWVLVSAPGYALRGFPEVFQPGRVTEVRYALAKDQVLETRVEGSRLLPSVQLADQTPQVSRTVITRADIERVPGAMEDISRVVQAAPGVAADPDLLATFFVRGGGPDEVVFYLDGVPLSNPYHLGGFASIFNPMLIESAEFYAGGQPARYEPSLSGVFEVKYTTAETKKVHVLADVSMQTAKLRADLPTGVEGLSATVAFRRSYFELYFELLKATGVVGTSVVAPDITEAFARFNYRKGRHQTLLTVVHAGDGMNFVVNRGEKVLVDFVGGLKIANSSQIASLQHRIDLGGDSNLSFTAAFTRDENLVSVTPPPLPEGEVATVDDKKFAAFANQAQRHDALGRSDLVLVHSAKHRTQVGLQYAWRKLAMTGQVTDGSTLAPWAAEPFVETWRPTVDIAPALTRSLLAAYLEHTWRPLEALALEGGGRVQYDTNLRQLSGSARLAGAVTLPTATVLKVSGGYAAQPVQQPLLLDPTWGNPALGPEQVATLIGALEQPLPFEAFVRVEGWGKWLSALAVNPDTEAGRAERDAAGLPRYENLGHGTAWGVDGLLAGRTRHFSYGVSFGVVTSERQNPLAAGVQRYPTPWDQRFTAAASLSWSPTSRWVVTGRANFRTGRPYTPVQGFSVGTDPEGEERWEPSFGDTNSARYPFYFELGLRAEHRFRFGPLAMGVYLEVLNVTNTTNVFAWIYGDGDVANRVEPQPVAFNHLPIRPFLGVKADY